MYVKKTKQALKDDFENAILYYHQNGTDLQTVLSYLDIKNLGGFLCNTFRIMGAFR